MQTSIMASHRFENEGIPSELNQAPPPWGDKIPQSIFWRAGIREVELPSSKIKRVRPISSRNNRPYIPFYDPWDTGSLPSGFVSYTLAFEQIHLQAQRSTSTSKSPGGMISMYRCCQMPYPSIIELGIFKELHMGFDVVNWRPIFWSTRNREHCLRRRSPGLVPRTIVCFGIHKLKFDLVSTISTPVGRRLVLVS